MRLPFAILLAVTLLLSARSMLLADVGDIIPRPNQLQPLQGKFVLRSPLKICTDEKSDDVDDTAVLLRDLLETPTGFQIDRQTVDADAPKGSILLTRKDADPALGNEGYELIVHPDAVVIRANTAAGLFYGWQSLRQLLPAQIESKTVVNSVAWEIPAVAIKDSPRYSWRGFMLDVARHFYDKAEVKHVLDLMAMQKQNVFHWHLTDDQGWRIEIKKYPLLTEQAAWRTGIGFNLDPKRTTHYREEDGKYGGFYTQDDIREVIAYAARRHILIVPEIEMPGHSQAALSVYPQFSSGKKQVDVGTKAGVMDSIYNAGDDATFDFVQDVLDEVIGLFPGPYIHVGGDEVPKGPWKTNPQCQARIKALGLKNEDELQSYFIKRIETFLKSKNRRLIGWDEILEGGLPPEATVMSWRGTAGGITAAKSGHDVVMTPTSHAYLDYSQTKSKKQQPTIGGFLPLKAVYSYDPTPADLSAEQARHILGAQGNLWTEYVPNMAQVEHQMFPRDCAMAEISWTLPARKDFNDFQRRLAGFEKRLDVLNVKYFVEPEPDAPPIATWSPSQMSTDLHPLQWDVTKAITKSGKYKVTFEYTGGGCRLDIVYAALQLNGAEMIRDTHDGRTGAANKNNIYELDVHEFIPGGKYTLEAMTRSDGGTDSNGDITITPE